MPAPIDQAQGSACIKIGPGGHGSGISIPGTGLFYQSYFNGINGLIAIVLELIAIKIIGDGVPVLNEVGDNPLTIGHCLDNKVLFRLLDGFFAAGKEEYKYKGYDNWFHKISVDPQNKHLGLLVQA